MSGFLGVPRTIYFGGLSLYFENFLARKTVGSRETPRDGLFTTGTKEYLTGHLTGDFNRLIKLKHPTLGLTLWKRIKTIQSIFHIHTGSTMSVVVSLLSTLSVAQWLVSLLGLLVIYIVWQVLVSWSKRGPNPFDKNSVRPKEYLEEDEKKRDAVLKQVLHYFTVVTRVSLAVHHCPDVS